MVINKLELKDFEQGRKLMAKFEKGFKNKHFKKFDRENLLEEIERLQIRLYQLKRRAGFYDKKNNIFSRGE